jgi:NitT/TauT family transport system substrate-binding protein
MGLVFTLALVAAVGCASTADASGPADRDGDGLIDITAGVAASQSSTALILGAKKGYFAEEGIDLTITYAATGAAGIPQVLNGQQQVVLGGISATITAVAEGIPVVIVSGSVNDRADPAGTQYQTIVPGDSDIHRFADLSGRLVAVNSLQCCWELWLREAVARDEGDPDSVEMVQLPFPDAVTALREERVDAISTVQPFATGLRRAGYRDIGDSPAVAYGDQENGNTVFTMSRQFVEANPGIVERWRRALQRSAEYANTHPDETRAQILEQTGANPDLVGSAPLPLYTAEIDRNAVQKEAEFLVRWGVLDSAPPLEELIVP